MDFTNFNYIFAMSNRIYHDKGRVISAFRARVFSVFSAAALANIIKFAIVNLRIDDDTLDYYYDVSIDDLLGSEMPDEEYEVMKEQGWTINENYLKILI